MSDLDHQAYMIIEHLENQCQLITNHIETINKRALSAEDQSKTLHAELENAKQEIENLKQINQTQHTNLMASQKALEIESISQKPEQITDNQHNDSLKLQQKITELEAQNQTLDEKYQSTYSLLQKEMVKVDTMQMELELAQRERDIALRKQSLTPEQKQLMIKLEHENYKINEAIERINYISDTLHKILEPTPETV